jgi:pyruvate dehydrogenase E2 component (dihydrolipoamide acetyltransferase)
VVAEEVVVITTLQGSDDVHVDSAGGRVLISPNARRVAAELGVDLASVQGTGPGGRIVSEDVEEAAARAPQSAGAGQPGKVVSPLARRDAREAGIDPSTIPTDDGVVRRSDVKAAASTPQSTAAAAVVPVAMSTPGAMSAQQETASIIPMKGMRGTIAARMQQSLTEMAQLTHGFEVGMDAVVALRAEMKQQYSALGVPVPSLNDFVVRAAALALRQHPILNATIQGNEIHLLSRIHMGLAVAVPGGLMVPVIRDADRLSLPELAATTRDLAERCRSGSIGLDELEGGTFAVTSLGTYGVDMFTPVINPGNVGILGVGRLRDSGKWEGDAWVRTQVLTLSLTFDHRVVDGAPAAEYLQTMYELLARPLVLVS